jgi:hypothetical protein
MHLSPHVWVPSPSAAPRLSTATRSGLPIPGDRAHSRPMGTKSRETIYGASVRVAAERATGGAQGSRSARRRGVEQAHARLSGSGAAIADAGRRDQRRVWLSRSEMPRLQHASDRRPGHRATTEDDAYP